MNINKISASAVGKVASLLLVGLLTSCASNPSARQSVEQRAMGYWEAQINGELTTAYEYLSPGYRSSVNSNAFQKQMLMKKVKWTDARYVEGDCTETTCKVRISLDYTVFAAVPGLRSFSSTQVIEENWVLVDGVWYLVPER